MRATSIIGGSLALIAACGGGVSSAEAIHPFGYIGWPNLPGRDGRDSGSALPCVDHFGATEGDPAWVLGSLQKGFGCLAGYHRERNYPVSAALYDLAGSIVAFHAERPETQIASEAWRRAQEIRREAERRLAEAERLQAEAERKAERAAAARRNAAIMAGIQAGASIATEAVGGDPDRTAEAVSEAAAEVGALAIELQREAADAERELDELGSEVAEVQAQYREIVEVTAHLAYATPVDDDYAADRLVVARLVASVGVDVPRAMLERIHAFSCEPPVAAVDPHLAMLTQRAIDAIASGSSTPDDLRPVLERLAGLELAAATYERWGAPMPPAESPEPALAPPPGTSTTADPFEDERARDLPPIDAAPNDASAIDETTGADEPAREQIDTTTNDAPAAHRTTREDEEEQ